MTKPRGSPQADLQTIVDAMVPLGSGMERGFYTLHTGAYDVRTNLKFRTEIAQGRELVAPTMLQARHVFRGLGRFVEDEAGLDHGPDFLIYTWKPDYDVVWVGDEVGGPERRPAHPDRVFITIVSPVPGPRPAVGPVGWCVRWNWAAEDPALKEAPVDWRRRYTRKIWTRPESETQTPARLT